MRALARWGITPLLAAPLGAWALGLGDIESQSALNQPFKAEIALSATPEELQGLRITLAGNDTLERYGIDRPAFLSALEFRVAADRRGDGRVDAHGSLLAPPCAERRRALGRPGSRRHSAELSPPAHQTVTFTVADRCCVADSVARCSRNDAIRTAIMVSGG